MVFRSVHGRIQLRCIITNTKFHVAEFRHQSKRILSFHSNSVLNTPTFANIRHKSSAVTKEVSTVRDVWNKIFGKYLLATNIIGSGVLMAVGDLAAQEICYRRNMHCKREYDWHRLGRMFIVGALQGPLHHYVYNWMDKVMPAKSLKNISRKILFDEIIMSPICILMFFYPACFLEKKTLAETNAEIVEKFPYIYIADWAFWPAAQYVNFRFLDTKYRVTYVNMMTALYNIFMSFMKHEFDTDR